MNGHKKYNYYNIILTAGFMIKNFDSEMVKSLNYTELNHFAEDIRAEIIDDVSKNGGHLASNLGVVELTLALHRVFKLPTDRLIFDVSHQSYVHKLLSGRADGLKDLRTENGVSGFQLRSESEYDCFGGGHSGTSVSAALGFAEADIMNGSDAFTVAVVGDGSFTNGMIYEAMNNASKSGLRLIIVLNDNEMSISENVGAVPTYFGRLRSSVKYHKFKRRIKSGLSKLKFIGRPIAWITAKIKNLFKRIVVKTTLFENLGLAYMGPVDGHNQKKLEAILKEAKLVGRPVVVHVCTQKGRGYAFAEERPELYHSVSPFDKDKGVQASETSSFSNAFGEALCTVAQTNKDIVSITAAMCEGTGLNKFKSLYPDRLFDVGIAEEHAVTFAAGLAAAGKRPVVAIYSSFLQRSYDQILHDVALQSLPVIFAIDRAGFVAGDGITHQGIFDVSFMLQMPHMTVFAPENYSDLTEMLNEAINLNTPSAIRYPKGRECEYDRSLFTEQNDLRYADFGHGKKAAIITYGQLTYNAVLAARSLEKVCAVRVISLKKLSSIKIEQFIKLFDGMEFIIFVDEQISNGGVAEHIISDLINCGYTLPDVKTVSVSNELPCQASVENLQKRYGMDAQSIASIIYEKLK
jgi:1-deoxy-D-xylulose-5-phosphate synthase